MPFRFLKRFTRGVFILLTLLPTALFLLACLTPYIDNSSWWIAGFLGIAFPYLVIVQIFLLIFWIIAKPRYALIPFVSLLVGYGQLRVLFAVNISPPFTEKKQAGHLRILSWNIRNFVALSDNPQKIKHNKDEVVSAILRLEADVLCLQEFNHSATKGEQDNNIKLFTKEYPYHYFSRDLVKKNGFYEYGSIIFSKYPMIDSSKVKFPGRTAESLISADFKRGDDTFRVYTTHLQSFRFNEGDYQDIEKIQLQEEDALGASKNIFKKMKAAFIRRSVQAGIVRKELDRSPHPYIITGDFNDVPNSYVYFHIRGNAKDAFLEKEFGIGRTYISLAPTLRIDYILASPHFEVKQFELVDEDLSDHLMMVADLKLNH